MSTEQFVRLPAGGTESYSHDDDWGNRLRRRLAYGKPDSPTGGRVTAAEGEDA